MKRAKLFLLKNAHCVPPTKLTENEVKNIIAKY